MKYTNLHIKPVFGGRGKAEGPNIPGDTVYRGPVNWGFTVDPTLSKFHYGLNTLNKLVMESPVDQDQKVNFMS